MVSKTPLRTRCTDTKLESKPYSGTCPQVGGISHESVFYKRRVAPRGELHMKGEITHRIWFVYKMWIQWESHVMMLSLTKAVC